MDGMEEIISAIRIRIISAHFPAYPAAAPQSTPIQPLISALAMPMTRLIPAPYQTRANRSLPNRSVPNQWSREDAWLRIWAFCSEYDHGQNIGTATASRIQIPRMMQPAAAIRLPPMYFFS